MEMENTLGGEQTSDKLDESEGRKRNNSVPSRDQAFQREGIATAKAKVGKCLVDLKAGKEGSTTTWQ